MEELNDRELEALIVFRKNVEDILLDDYTRSNDFLIRWLRARDCNQSLAEEMLRKHFLWRKTYDIDGILDLPPDPYFAENYPYNLDGVALNGGPVLCVSMRNWDMRRIVWDDKIPQFQAHINRLLERICAQIRSFNESRRRRPADKATGTTIIVNWEAFSIFQMTSIKGVQAILKGVAIYEAHFPEILAAALFINTNYVFQMLYLLVKPLLGPRTLAKLSCYGSDRSVWEPAVRALVDANQIPHECGGIDRSSHPEN